MKRPILNLAFDRDLTQSENSNVIMVASALPKTGKTFCSFNLASSIAKEKDVGAILVDADVLKPNISRSLGIDDRLGLIDYLLDESISIDDILVATDLFGIIVVPAGRQHPDATELLASRRMNLPHVFRQNMCFVGQQQWRGIDNNCARAKSLRQRFDQQIHSSAGQ